ncbi:MAG: hypothetical protein HY716_07400 [Planctomycetes bacterium]|nr:hypothetical protein [Planctomycetota bacterium]
MKAHIIMADAASMHPDGTFSLLRGGITTVNIAKGRPLFFKGAMVARVLSEPGESGPHEFRIRCVDDDGKPVAQDLDGKFEIPPQGGTVQLVLDMQIVFPKFGRYEFSLAVNRRQMDAWMIEVKEIEVKTGPM